MASSARRASVFGFHALLLSAAGQTYFIGLFGAPLRDALGLSEAGLGLLFGSATIASGGLMFWLGAVADRTRLHRAVVAAVLLIVAGAALMATATSALMLLAAFFLLRLGGQGLCGHLGVVAAARYADTGKRGRAMSITVFGVVAGEALWPPLLALALGVLDWRQIWWLVVAGWLLAGLPLLYWLARPLPAPASMPHDTRPDLRRRDLFRLPRFLAPIGVLVVPAFTITAVFFHQSSISDAKGWTLSDIAPAFALYAVAQAATNVLTGRLIDRFSAISLMRVQLWPLAAAMLTLVLLPVSAGPWITFALLGVTTGANSVIVGALWAELFGTRQLGLVRGVYASMMVLATALSPILVGLLLSWQVALAWMCLPMAVYAVVVPWALARFVQPPEPGRI